MNELSTRYNHKEAEDKWYKFWEDKGYFCAKPNPAKKPFCIVIPPPNVTGILHMGHALNNTIQDILTRYHRLKGEEALWMPGVDHAGIATQNVVEKTIAKEGLKRQDLGREKFLEKVWQWKEEYGSTIIRQLKKLGASCDWQRMRFTMDGEYSRAVKEVFVRLWNKGLVYQDDKVINWCPRCQTALADEEAPHRELAGNLYYLKYPFKDEPEKFVVVATTRPETMLGDTAVAVNPKDKRYKKLVGRALTLPLINREIKIIADSMVDMKFGTGAVKVTPAHDPNDYLLGKKHRLDFINILHPDGRLNANTGEYNGMDRFEAREVILEDLKERGLLEKIEAHRLSAGHCYRCHTVIEPYLSRQWFVKMKPLAKPAVEVVRKGKVKFHPKRWTKVYLNWMENIQDWCISRQIWWGHRIPLWYCLDCKKEAVAVIEKPDACRSCKSTNLKQDEDVLDTWFSSWLWPFATFYWPFDSRQQAAGSRQQQDLEYFYPTSILVTAPEIIFFWVARMIMAGLEFMKDIPFRDVYIHGTVRDIEGKKMSKSLGNIIDPLDIINQYGADALRFSLISITAQGQDVFLSKERFEQGRNFANKIWNASRFILMNLEPSLTNADLCAFFKKEDLDTVNRWILSRFYSTLKAINNYLESFKLNEAANLLYAFFWHEFCDWYLEIVKADIKHPHNQLVMFKVLEKFLRLIHPFMPFISEEIWQKIKNTRMQGHPASPAGPPAGQAGGRDTSIMTERWPHLEEQMIDKKLEKQAESIFNLIKEIRNLRSLISVKPQEKVLVSLYPHSKQKQQLVGNNKDLVINLSRLEGLQVLDKSMRPESTISSLTGEIDIYLHYSGLIDIDNVRAGLEKKLTNIGNLIKAKSGRIKNKDFLKKAPQGVVNQEKEALVKLEGEIKRLKKMADELR
ncbi:MAG: valine--tRNA ligase [Candidatus Omnitrophota bacterium]|nr:MAG: valine--tRNA ligase [Candidatus Omnitrophota bacterium]